MIIELDEFGLQRPPKWLTTINQYWHWFSTIKQSYSSVNWQFNLENQPCLVETYHSTPIVDHSWGETHGVTRVPGWCCAANPPSALAWHPGAFMSRMKGSPLLFRTKNTQKKTDPVSSDLSWWKREQSQHGGRALKSPACWLQPAWNILVWLDMVRSSQNYPKFKVKKNQDRSSRFESKQHFFWSFFGASKD